MKTIQYICCLMLFFCSCGIANANTICDDYNDILTSVEINSIERNFRLPFPAEYSTMLSNVNVRNESDANIITPNASWDVGSPNTASINIPKGFQKLHCKLIISSSSFINGRYSSTVPAKKMMDECMIQNRDSLQCLNKVLDHLLKPFDVTAPAERAYQEKWRAWIESSFQFVIAHEVSHIVLAGQSQTEIEAAADSQAAFALSISGENIQSAIGLFRMWSIVDDHVDWKSENHPSFACRAASLSEIYKKVAPKVALVDLWSKDISEFKTSRAKIEWDDQISASFFDAPVCKTSSFSHSVEVASDLNQLLVILDNASNNIDEAPVQVVNQIIEQNLSTQEAKWIRADLITIWTLKYVFNGFGLGDGKGLGEDIKSDDENPMRAFRQFQRTSSTLLKIAESQLDPRYVSSEGYGEHLFSIYSLKPTVESRGISGMGGSISEMAKKLPLLELYSPNSPQIFYVRGLQFYKRGDCEKGSEMIKKASDLGLDLGEDMSEYADPPFDKQDCRDRVKFLRYAD